MEAAFGSMARTGAAARQLEETGPTYRLRDPATQRWTKDVARALDRGFNAAVGEEPDEDFVEPAADHAQAWPKWSPPASRGLPRRKSARRQNRSFRRGSVAGGSTLLVTDNDRAFTKTVRKQRRSLLIALAVVAALSVLLSLFLARTIVRPLRRIALAAHRVRLGRAREVKVPRLPREPTRSGCLPARSAT